MDDYQRTSCFHILYDYIFSNIQEKGAQFKKKIKKDPTPIEWAKDSQIKTPELHSVGSFLIQNFGYDNNPLLKMNW